MRQNKDHIAKLIWEKDFSSTENLVLTMAPGGNLHFWKFLKSYTRLSEISPKISTCTRRLLLQKIRNVRLKNLKKLCF